MYPLHATPAGQQKTGGACARHDEELGTHDTHTRHRADVYQTTCDASTRCERTHYNHNDKHTNNEHHDDDEQHDHDDLHASHAAQKPSQTARRHGREHDSHDDGHDNEHTHGDPHDGAHNAHMLAGYARESHNRNHPRNNYHDDEYYPDYYYYYYYYYHHAHGDEHQQEDVYHRRRGSRAVAPTPPLDLTPLGHWARSDAPYPDAESRDSRANLTTVLPGSTQGSRATLTTVPPYSGFSGGRLKEEGQATQICVNRTFSDVGTQTTIYGPQDSTATKAPTAGHTSPVFPPPVSCPHEVIPQDDSHLDVDPTEGLSPGTVGGEVTKPPGAGILDLHYTKREPMHGFTSITLPRPWPCVTNPEKDTAPELPRREAVQPDFHEQRLPIESYRWSDHSQWKPSIPPGTVKPNTLRKCHRPKARPDGPSTPTFRRTVDMTEGATTRTIDIGYYDHRQAPPTRMSTFLAASLPPLCDHREAAAIMHPQTRRRCLLGERSRRIWLLCGKTPQPDTPTIPPVQHVPFSTCIPGVSAAIQTTTNLVRLHNTYHALGETCEDPSDLTDDEEPGYETRQTHQGRGGIPPRLRKSNWRGRGPKGCKLLASRAAAPPRVPSYQRAWDATPTDGPPLCAGAPREDTHTNTGKRGGTSTSRKVMPQRRAFRGAQPLLPIQQWLECTSLTRHCNTGKGNCLFLAAAQALRSKGHKAHHRHLREQTADYLRANPGIAEEAWDGLTPDAPAHQRPCTFEEYIVAVRQLGTWGGLLELQVLAHLFPGTSFLVLGPHMNPTTVCADWQHPPNPTRRIHLWLQDGHFEWISSTVPDWVGDLVWAFDANTSVPDEPPTVQETGPPGQQPPPGADSVIGDLSVDSAPTPPGSRGADPGQESSHATVTVGSGTHGAAAARPNTPPDQAVGTTTPSRITPAVPQLQLASLPVAAIPHGSTPGTTNAKDPALNILLRHLTPRAPGIGESLAQFSDRLVPRSPEWWAAAVEGTRGAYLMQVHTRVARTDHQELHITLLPLQSDPSPETLRCQPSPSSTGIAATLLCYGRSYDATDSTLEEDATLLAIHVVLTQRSPMVFHAHHQIDPLSGVYRIHPDTNKDGLADLACGIGGFTVGGLAAGWRPVVAIDTHPQAVEAYRALHGETHPCLCADLLCPDTLRQVTHANPAVIALGFPCQPFSAAGYQRGFGDERSRILLALLTYAAVLRPHALVLENVHGFAVAANGDYARQLGEALAALAPAFHTQAETVDLREVRPLKRTRWLAFCPRQSQWLRLPPHLQRLITTATWTPRRSRTLASLGIPRPGASYQDMMLPQDSYQRYIDGRYLPNDFRSRYVQNWDALPALTHSYGSEFCACPCGCRPAGLSEFHLRKKGVFALLVRLEHGARLLAPEEAAQLMGFSRHTYWAQVAPGTGLALLGNAISPLHAGRVMGRLAMFSAILAQMHVTPQYLPGLIQHIIHHADRPQAAPAPPAPTPLAGQRASTPPPSQPEDMTPPPRQNEERVNTPAPVHRDPISPTQPYSEGTKPQRGSTEPIQLLRKRPRPRSPPSPSSDLEGTARLRACLQDIPSTKGDLDSEERRRRDDVVEDSDEVTSGQSEPPLCNPLNHDSPMLIFCQVFNKPPVAIPAHPQWLVGDFRRILALCFGIAVQHQRLRHRGEDMRDDLTLQQQQVRHWDTLHIVLSLRGGAEPSQRQGPPPSSGIDPPPGLQTSWPPAAGQRRPTQPFDQAAGLSEFLDSIVTPCCAYGRALRLSEGDPDPDTALAQARQLGFGMFRNWETLAQVLHTLFYRLDSGCAWKCLGIAKLEGPPPTAEMADLRIGKVMVLLRAARPTGWSQTDVALADGAVAKFQQAYEEITRELPQILAIRKRYPCYLVPAYAELPMAILDSWTRTIHAEGPNWRSAAMLSNTQDIPLTTIPGALSVQDARRIQDQLVRDNDRGLNALMALGSKAGLLMWAPTEHEQVHRLLAIYEVAAVQLADPPTLLLMVPHDPYPGVETTDLLYDLWKHPLQQRSKSHLVRQVAHLPLPIRCTLTGAFGPRTVDKAITLYTLAGSDRLARIALPRPTPIITVDTGTTLLLDGPVDDYLPALRALHDASLPGMIRWDGPLRSFGTSRAQQRVLLKVYLHRDVTDLTMAAYLSRLRSSPELSRFAVGTEKLFADVTTRRVEITSPEVIPLINPIVDQVVVVSPRLLLVHTQASQQDWVQALTTMHHLDAEVAVTLVTWRCSHHQGDPWAAPEMLQARASALRQRARHNRRPGRLSHYQRHLTRVTLRGPKGPDPEALLATLATQVQTAMGRPFARGRSAEGLESDQFWEERDARGHWTGTIHFLLPDLVDIIATHRLLEGATVQVGSACSTIAVRNPQLDADPSLLHTQGNGETGHPLGNGQGSDR